MWITLVIFYGLLKGIRDVLKKKSLEKNTVIEVLLFYTALSFLLVLPEANTAFRMDMSFMPYVLIKSFVIFIGWMCGYTAIENMPVSLYGVVDMARVVFAAVISIIFLGESFTIFKLIGMLLVISGLFMVNRNPKIETASPKYLFFALICCLCNAISENLDKFLMTSINSIQLQFWYMLYLVIFYAIYVIIKRIKLNFRSALKNYWIPISAITFVIGDRALFIACSSGDSSVIVMTLIKQCSVLFTILGGGLFFRERDLLYRIICACVIIVGIWVSIL